MYRYILYQKCKDTGPRGSKYTFLQGGMDVHIL